MGCEETTCARLRDALRLAWLSCLGLGLGLLVWGFTPAVVLRLVSRDPPPWEALATSSLTVLVGITFVGLGELIRRGVSWALRATLCVSVFLLFGALGVLLIGWSREVPLFPTILAIGTTLTSWLAIATEDAVRQAGQSPAPPAPGACPPGEPKH
jgi:hypothetical protein